MMNFSPEKCKKLEKKFQTLPLACFSIVAEYVGLFFISSECSIQSSFLLFCKILVYVGFAMVNNSAVSIRLSIATYLCGNIVICINSKFCEKCSDTHLRVSAKLPLWNHSLFWVRKSVPIFVYSPRRIQRAWATCDFIVHFFFGW